MSGVGAAGFPWRRGAVTRPGRGDRDERAAFSGLSRSDFGVRAACRRFAEAAGEVSRARPLAEKGELFVGTRAWRLRPLPTAIREQADTMGRGFPQ
jgi:hypothetical protein